MCVACPGAPVGVRAVLRCIQPQRYVLMESELWPNLVRRATLRGKENLCKRHKIAAACFNLSLLLRTLLGVGTPKQWAAGTYSLLMALFATFSGQHGGFAPFAPKRRLLSPLFISSSESQTLNEKTGFVESRSGAVKFRRSLSGDQPFRLLVPEELAVLSVSTPRSSNRTCGFPASGFRTR